MTMYDDVCVCWRALIALVQTMMMVMVTPALRVECVVNNTVRIAAFLSNSYPLTGVQKAFMNTVSSIVSTQLASANVPLTLKLDYYNIDAAGADVSNYVSTTLSRGCCGLTTDNKYDAVIGPLDGTGTQSDVGDMQ